MLLLAFLFLGWYAPRLGDGVLAKGELLGARLAEKKCSAIVCIALAALLIRLALLPFLPISVPRIQDEFSYLLAGDTFAHGRLTNPPHPMWVFFDTMHVNQHPTYMSKYPPAQGAVLALGQVLGNPWLGVLISGAAMCAAVLWMLQGWLPARWALLGGFLVLVRLGILTYWMNSYWGGAVPAIGGALVAGALPRVLHFHRSRDAILLGLGGGILINSRPLEGFILCLPVMIVLVAWLCSKRSPSWHVTLPRLILPLCIVAFCSLAFVAYYNWRGTGNPLLFPYVVNDQTYFSTPAFVWQKAGPPLHYMNPQFESFYNGWAHDYWLHNRVDSLQSAGKHVLMVGLKLVYFFLWPELCVPLIALPWLLRDKRTRFLAVQAGLCIAGFFAVIWFLPHYAAPLTATLFALLIQAIRHLRRWEYRGRPVGIGLSRVVVLLAVILAPFHQRAALVGPEPAKDSGLAYRARFEAQLSAMPGKQLAIVRYSANTDGEWVYNKADIDGAKVVWAREIPGIDPQPLLDYFKGATRLAR